MKKLTLGLMTGCMLLLCNPTLLKAEAETETATTATTVTATAKSAEISKMEIRLNEIKAMDMKTLNSAEKKELRKEVRAIKSDIKAVNNGGGVYISVGAAILIVLLL
ncbi:MAG: hypothetical protein Q8K69_07255, partial [Bacteroidota bacterium]|nr:hypothetical protein [Bacteroidota bacterium]